YNTSHYDKRQFWVFSTFVSIECGSWAARRENRRRTGANACESASILVEGILGRKRECEAVHVPEAGRGAETGTAGIAGIVPGPRLIAVRPAELRSGCSGPGLFDDECLRQVRLRCLDDGLRKLWQVDAHGRELEYCRRCEGS